MTTTAVPLPLDLRSDSRDLDALTARAIRLALWPDRSLEEAAAELCEAVHGNVRLLHAAIARVDRALASEWSRSGALALAELAAARARLERAERGPSALVAATA